MKLKAILILIFREVYMKEYKRNKAKEYLKMKRCKYCKATKNLTIDHKVPLILGGKDEFKNLQCLCKRCNGLKSDMPDKQIRSTWRWFLDIQKNREEKGAKPYRLF